MTGRLVGQIRREAHGDRRWLLRDDPGRKRRVIPVGMEEHVVLVRRHRSLRLGLSVTTPRLVRAAPPGAKVERDRVTPEQELRRLLG